MGLTVLVAVWPPSGELTRAVPVPADDFDSILSLLSLKLVSSLASQRGDRAVNYVYATYLRLGTPVDRNDLAAVRTLFASDGTGLTVKVC